MIRIVPALLTALLLSGCAMMGVGRMPGTTDVQCMRRAMAHGNTNNNGPLPFDMATSVCAQFDNRLSPWDKGGSTYLPLDLRADPELQRMAEDPTINDSGYAYVPRESKAPPTGPRWGIGVQQ